MASEPIEESLKQLLKCGVCLEQVDTPKVLPLCQHTICIDCVKRLNIRDKKFKCPTCKKVFYVITHIFAFTCYFPKTVVYEPVLNIFLKLFVADNSTDETEYTIKSSVLSHKVSTILTQTSVNNGDW